MKSTVIITLAVLTFFLLVASLGAIGTAIFDDSLTDDKQANLVYVSSVGLILTIILAMTTHVLYKSKLADDEWIERAYETSRRETILDMNKERELQE